MLSTKLAFGMELMAILSETVISIPENMITIESLAFLRFCAEDERVEEEEEEEEEGVVGWEDCCLFFDTGGVVGEGGGE